MNCSDIAIVTKGKTLA